MGNQPIRAIPNRNHQSAGARGCRCTQCISKSNNINKDNELTSLFDEYPTYIDGFGCKIREIPNKYIYQVDQWLWDIPNGITIRMDLTNLFNKET
jgi:hypothetical protein